MDTLVLPFDTPQLTSIFIEPQCPKLYKVFLPYRYIRCFVNSTCVYISWYDVCLFHNSTTLLLCSAHDPLQSCRSFSEKGNPTIVKYTVPMQSGTHLLEHSLAVVLVFHALSLFCQDNFEPQACFPTQLCVICKCMSGITDAITEQNQSRKTSGRPLAASLCFTIERSMFCIHHLVI